MYAEVQITRGELQRFSNEDLTHGYSGCSCVCGCQTRSIVPKLYAHPAEMTLSKRTPRLCRQRAQIRAQRWCAEYLCVSGYDGCVQDARRVDAARDGASKTPSRALMRLSAKSAVKPRTAKVRRSTFLSDSHVLVYCALPTQTLLMTCSMKTLRASLRFVSLCALEHRPARSALSFRAPFIHTTSHISTGTRLPTFGTSITVDV